MVNTCIQVEGEKNIKYVDKSYSFLIDFNRKLQYILNKID